MAIDPSDESVPGDPGRWNRMFAENPADWFFGREPSEMARLTLQYWRQLRGESSGRVLDLGCGEGRDSVYFARHGFAVTSVDSSDAGIEKLARLAGETGVCVPDVHLADVRDFTIQPGFDIVFAHNCLQFIGADCLSALARIQDVTPGGGVNAISVFTRESEALAGRDDLYRFDRNELKFLYRTWRILFYGEEILWRDPAKMYLSFARIIAVKADEGVGKQPSPEHLDKGVECRTQ